METKFKYNINDAIWYLGTKRTIKKQILEITENNNSIFYIPNDSSTKISEDKIVKYSPLYEVFRNTSPKNYVNTTKPYAYWCIFGANENLVNTLDYPFNKNIKNIPEHFYNLPANFLDVLLNLNDKSGLQSVKDYIDSNIESWINSAIEKSIIDNTFDGLIVHDIESFPLSYKTYYSNNTNDKEKILADKYGNPDNAKSTINPIAQYFYLRLISTTKKLLPNCKQTIYDAVSFEYWVFYDNNKISQYEQVINDRIPILKKLDCVTSCFYTRYKVVSDIEYVSDGSKGEKQESNIIPYQKVAEIGNKICDSIKRPFGIFISPNLRGIDPMSGEYAGDLALDNIISTFNSVDFVVIYNWLSNDTNNKNVIDRYNSSLEKFYNLLLN